MCSSAARGADRHEASDDVAPIHNISSELFANFLRLVAYPKAETNRVSDAIIFVSIALLSYGERLSILPDDFS
jgi:hypothetical protein